MNKEIKQFIGPAALAGSLVLAVLAVGAWMLDAQAGQTTGNQSAQILDALGTDSGRTANQATISQ